MPLRLSIERKAAEVDCMRLGGANKSALLSFDEKKKINGVSVDVVRFRSVVLLTKKFGFGEVVK